MLIAAAGIPRRMLVELDPDKLRPVRPKASAVPRGPLGVAPRVHSQRIAHERDLRALHELTLVILIIVRWVHTWMRRAAGIPTT